LFLPRSPKIEPSHSCFWPNLQKSSHPQPCVASNSEKVASTNSPPPEERRRAGR
jgi:hypothetical protein